MRAARPGGAGADAQVARELGLTGRSQGGAFFVADPDPFDLAPSHRVGERIERVADQAEDMLDPDLLEPADQNVGNRLGHRPLLSVFVRGVCTRRPPGALIATP